MNQEQQVNAAIAAIRAISQLYGEDIAAITAALSCKVKTDCNSHLRTHEVAVDSLDDLSLYLVDMVEAV